MASPGCGDPWGAGNLLNWAQDVVAGAEALDVAPLGHPAAGRGAPPLSRRPVRQTCQQCGGDLEGHKRFYKRYHTCETCALASTVEQNGSLSRFCQQVQCGRFHPLDFFNGLMRTCREQLARHAERQRVRRQQKRKPTGKRSGGGGRRLARSRLSEDEPEEGSESEDGPSRGASGSPGGTPHHYPHQHRPVQRHRQYFPDQQQLSEQQLLLSATEMLQQLPPVPLVPPITPHPQHQQHQNQPLGWRLRQEQQFDWQLQEQPNSLQAWEQLLQPQSPPACLSAHDDSTTTEALTEHQVFWLGRLATLLHAVHQDEVQRVAAGAVAVVQQAWA